MLAIGGTSGFWGDTVRSLAEAALYEQSIATALGTYVLVWVAISVITIGYLAVTSQAPVFRFLVAVTFGAAALSVVQHWILGIVYLEGRRGLFLIPLFFLCVIGAIHSAQQGVRPTARLVMIGFLALPTMALTVAAIGLANQTHTKDWRYDADSKRALLFVLERLSSTSPGTLPVTMEVSWIFQPSSNFYRRTLGMEKHIREIVRDPVNGSGDFVYGTET